MELESFRNYTNLRPEDIQVLIDWSKCEPHLPNITEQEAIQLLISCSNSIETAKHRIDAHFTCRTHLPEIFSNRNIAKLTKDLQVTLYFPVSQLTPNNERIVMIQLLDPNPANFNLMNQLKLFFMTTDIWMNLGVVNGYHLVLDLQGMQFGHITKFSLITMKKILYYLQNALPVKPTGIHMIHIGPVLDKLMLLLKPFIKPELFKLIHFHTDYSDTLYKCIPQKILPRHLGGDGPTVKEMQDIMVRSLKNAELYFNEDEINRRVDETKRVDKSRNLQDLFGVEGSFKKLEID